MCCLHLGCYADPLCASATLILNGLCGNKVTRPDGKKVISKGGNFNSSQTLIIQKPDVSYCNLVCWYAVVLGAERELHINAVVLQDMHCLANPNLSLCSISCNCASSS